MSKGKKTGGKIKGSTNLWSDGDCKPCLQCRNTIYRYQTNMQGLKYTDVKFCDEFCSYEHRSEINKSRKIKK